MNKTILIGRLTKDPELKGNDKVYTRFTLAVDRVGSEGADFIPIVVFGKQAENAVKYLVKGRKVAVEGRINTGSYEKDGKKVYTTDVIAERVEFLEWGDKASAEGKPEADSYAQIDEDVPWID